ncbi:uncharacterized protein PFL1_04903 [Pseudozyma flocculosa PF-1]|uniref:Uncharacterized protein n=1 Tax=Pseudozyma flocculosa PF-1 TaxID=1277687 RepID=A0A061H4J7_9BASI|nr:uncharacterized protein PFL1_04903 [Pseudozyma flocculosa PF-1]EPQ27364.1 hypothetical protein PFL1_04903 [Pseudozyma flocculosa PF-1]
MLYVLACCAGRPSILDPTIPRPASASRARQKIEGGKRSLSAIWCEAVPKAPWLLWCATAAGHSGLMRGERARQVSSSSSLGTVVGWMPYAYEVVVGADRFACEQSKPPACLLWSPSPSS